MRSIFFSDVFRLLLKVFVFWLKIFLPSWCFLGQETLLHIVSLHPSVYRELMMIMLGVTMQWTSIPSRGGGGE